MSRISNVASLVFLQAFVFTSCFLSSDAAGQEFPEIYNSEKDVAAKPMPALEAAAGFELPDNLEVKVFAEEPDVQNPIAMTWDSKGRLWVAENFTYAERSQRFDLSLRDRVLIFEDRDQDGVADKRSAFTDQVQMLTSVEVGHGGVWLMCPQKLLFVPDADHDDQPDGPAVTVLDGFKVAKVSHHNFANGLKWGPDGWLYGRCGGSCPGRIGPPGTPNDRRVILEGGIWRFHPRTKHFEVLSHGTTNPWGHDWNEYGDGFFINTVNGHLWHLIPGAHFDRPFTLDPNPHVYELIQMHADHWHFDTKGKWQKSRDGAANDFGGGHAHCGMSIYLGGTLPEEYHGRLLTLNFHGRRMNQELLHRTGSGYVGKHGPDTLIAADPFFRGMDVSYGPDGNLVVLDWSDTGECHEATGVHRTSGRIYSVRNRSSKPEKTEPVLGSDLRSLTSVKLAELMEHPNEWYVRQARLILSERAPNLKEEINSDRETYIDILLKQFGGEDPKIAYRALATLVAMDIADRQLIESAMSHSNEHLRAWAIRWITDQWPIDDVFGPNYLSKKNESRVAEEYSKWEILFCKMAEEDASGLVRLNLASTLQRLPIANRAPLASALMSRGEDANDHNLPLLVWYGLIPVADAEPSGLAKVAIQSKWPQTQRLIARRLSQQIEKSPDAVDDLVKFIATASEEVQENLLQGLTDGLRGWRRAPQPASWPDCLAAIESSQPNDSPNQNVKTMVRDLSILFGDGRTLDYVKKIVLDKKATIDLRRSALETLVASKSQGIEKICLPLLSDARINTVALAGVAESGDPKVAAALIKNYRKFRAPNRPKVIEVLGSRVKFADALLTAIAAKKIPSDDLTAYDVRQIRSLEDQSLNQRIAETWGEIRDTPAEKTERIEGLKKLLTADRLAQGSPQKGRLLFNKSCAKCHRLFGYGETVGPELTGGNRNNLDYLLENIIDPSAVVSKDFRMTILTTTDGQTLNGLVTNRTEKTLTLQTQHDLKTILIADIEDTRLSRLSSMPDGMLDNLSQEQIVNLIGYLMQPSQVPVPEETPNDR